MNKKSCLVYSTQAGRICPECGQPVSRCLCDSLKKKAGVSSDGIIRIQREVKGRGGKTASVIQGCDLPLDELKKLAQLLKQVCGTGGTVKDGLIIIQGDHRERLLSKLKEMGFTAKLSGG